MNFEWHSASPAQYAACQWPGQTEGFWGRPCESAGSPWNCMQQGSHTWSPWLKRNTWDVKGRHTNTERHENWHDRTYLDDFINVSLCIDIDVADSLAVTQHRDAFGRPLNISNQLGGTSRNDQVDDLVQLAQILHLLTSAHLATYSDLLFLKWPFLAGKHHLLLCGNLLPAVQRLWLRAWKGLPG